MGSKSQPYHDEMGLPDHDGISTLGRIVLSILCLPIVIIGLLFK